MLGFRAGKNVGEGSRLATVVRHSFCTAGTIQVHRARVTAAVGRVVFTATSDDSYITHWPVAGR
jgi:hypothetical protein